MRYFFKLVAVFLCFGSYLMSAAEKFTDDDIGRIVCRPAFGNTRQFLVLDKINISGSVNCRIYGTRKSVEVQSNTLTATKFYENSSLFLITQYALIGQVTNQQPNLAMELAKLNSGASERITRWSEFENAGNQFQMQLKAALSANASSTDDQFDAFSEQLDNTLMPDMIKQAAATQDWTLAIIMYDHLYTILQRAIMPVQRSNPDLAGVAGDMLRDCLLQLLNDFGTQLSQLNDRRRFFRKYYPQARGLWTEAPPRDYRNLRRFCMRSLKSYMELEKLSRLIEPQDWGSAMLDVLLLTEGIPEAADLEKEFDDQMRRIEKSAAANRSN